MAGKKKYGSAAISEIKREAGVIGGRVSAAAKKVARAIGLTDKDASKSGTKRSAAKRSGAKRTTTKRATAKRATAKRGAAKRKVQQLVGATAIAATRRGAKKRRAARGTSVAKTNKKAGIRSSRRAAGRKPRSKVIAGLRARKSR